MYISQILDSWLTFYPKEIHTTNYFSRSKGKFLAEKSLNFAESEGHKYFLLSANLFPCATTIVNIVGYRKQLSNQTLNTVLEKEKHFGRYTWCLKNWPRELFEVLKFYLFAQTKKNKVFSNKEEVRNYVQFKISITTFRINERYI